MAGGVAAARLAVRGVCAVALLAAIEFADDVAQAVFVIAAVVIVVAAGIAGLLRAFAFFLVCLDDGGLDHLAAGGVDRVGDVGVELGPAVGAAGGAVLVEPAAALVAVPGPQVVLAATAGAAVRQLAAGHGNERALGAFDDLEVADDEAIVKRDRAEGEEAFVVVFHELDPDFGDDHSCSPFLAVDPVCI